MFTYLKFLRFLLVVGSRAREANMSSKINSLCFSYREKIWEGSRPIVIVHEWHRDKRLNLRLWLASGHSAAGNWHFPQRRDRYPVTITGERKWQWRTHTCKWTIAPRLVDYMTLHTNYKTQLIKTVHGHVHVHVEASSWKLNLGHSDYVLPTESLESQSLTDTIILQVHEL